MPVRLILHPRIVRSFQDLDVLHDLHTVVAQAVPHVKLDPIDSGHTLRDLLGAYHAEQRVSRRNQEGD